MMKKFLYIVSIFVMVILFDSCAKEPVLRIDGEDDPFTSTNDSNRDLVDNEDDGVFEDDDTDGDVDKEEEIEDPDNDDDEEDDDDNELIDDRSGDQNDEGL